MTYQSPPPPYQVFIILILLSLIIFVPTLRAQETWSAFTGPDGDYIISFPGTPERETKITPQKLFTGQQVELFILEVTQLG